MPKYIAEMNGRIAALVAELPDALLYGENIDKGSCISGLTRNLTPGPGSRILNVGNCELAHCGIGFGLMVNGVNAVLFVKQLDFMLLGVDHFANTYNLVQAAYHVDALGSFTIVTIVCDQGMQGSQSSFNDLGDLCSLARVPGYTITNSADADAVLGTQLGRPGFRFIALSQRLFGTEFLELEALRTADDASVFQYADGEDVTIVCCNFSLPEGLALAERAREKGISPALFSVNDVLPHEWRWIAESVGRTGKLVTLDDSKGSSPLCFRLLHEMSLVVPASMRVAVTREEEIDTGVSPDTLEVDHERVLERLMS